ncbi:unnamed protein product [Sphagnum balticum]
MCGGLHSRHRYGCSQPIQARHYEYVRLLSEEQLTAQDPSHRQLLLEAALHACDVGNPALEFDDYIYWANVVCMEFNDQTLVEEEQGLEPTEFLRFSSLPYFYLNQITFTSNVVLPLWKALSLLASDPYTLRAVKNISFNAGRLRDSLRRNSEPMGVLQKYLTLALVKRNDKSS